MPPKSGLLELHRGKQLDQEALRDGALPKQHEEEGNPRELVKEPTVFIVDYNDGLKAAAFLMTGMVEDFTVAVDVEGQSQPVSTLMNLQNGRPHHHFGCLVKNIEIMFETGKAALPGRAHAMTSGILDFALESRIPGLQETRHAATRPGSVSDAERLAFLHQRMGTGRQTPRLKCALLLSFSLCCALEPSRKTRHFVVAIGGVKHESNSFNPAKTVLSDFDGMRGTTTLTGAALLESLKEQNTELSGFLEAADAEKFDVYPGIYRICHPERPLSPGKPTKP